MHLVAIIAFRQKSLLTADYDPHRPPVPEQMPGLGFAIAGHADHMVRQQGRVAVRPHPHTRKIAKETVFDLPVAGLEVKVFSHVQHAVLAHGSLNVKQSDSFLPGG